MRTGLLPGPASLVGNAAQSTVPATSAITANAGLARA